tara:strand:- start:1935 stop:3689 length:1755 start_codon:yes stop_codon:yes gene_type:complete
MYCVISKFRSVNYIFNFFNFISSNNKTRFFYVFILSILSALGETLSVALLIPFIQYLIPKNDYLDNQNTFNFFLEKFFNLEINFFLLTTLLICVVIFSGFLRIFFFYFSTQTNCKIGHEISKKVFQTVFTQRYPELASSESQKIISGLVVQVDNMVRWLDCLSRFIAAIFLSSLILLFLLNLSLVTSIICISLLSLAYFSLAVKSRPKLGKLSKDIGLKIENQVKLLQEIYSMRAGFIIDKSFNPISKSYLKQDYKIRKLNASAEFMGSYPRSVIESIAIIIVLFLCLFFSKRDGFIIFIPFIGAYIYAIQRLIPSLQQVYAQWVGLKTYSFSINYIISILSQFKISTNYADDIFSNKLESIIFKDLTFNHNSASNSNSNTTGIQNINLKINKGSVLAIVGDSGSGKSTLLELLLGLRKPSKGEIIFNTLNMNMSNNVESKQEKALNFSYVPQSTSLINADFFTNIALSDLSKDIDRERVYFAAKIAMINQTIEDLDNKYFTNPIKDGLLLSGGQIQRIAIARAIYKKSSVLLLDEATSAIDSKTEFKILSNIIKLNLYDFIFLTSHRNSIKKFINGEIKLNKR